MKDLQATNKKTIAALKELKNSKLFNLSLGSKELFHSNFLAWLAENYSLEIGIVFSKFIKENKIINLIKEPPLREKENIDLTFTYEDNQILIIENKVKSLPSIDQLSKYSKDHNLNKSYLLLSLYKPNFINEKNQIIISKDGNEIIWNYLSYEQLAKYIKEAIEPKSVYDRFLIEDYICFIENLSFLESSIIINWEKDSFNFYTGKISDEINFRELRIHDFFLKHKYIQIKNKLIEQIKELNAEDVNFKINQEGDWINGNSGECFFEQGFTNSQGLVGFKFVIKIRRKQCPLVLGLQLQGNSLRLNVECPDGKYALSSAKILTEKGLWFTFDEVSRYQSDIKIKGKGQKNNEEFASFSDRFFYKYVSINSINMSVLVGVMAAYYSHIISKYDEINNVLKTIK
jgi:hypothetical protein